MKPVSFLSAIAAFAIMVLLGLGVPGASAQQINPTANSVHEDALLDALQSGQTVHGRVSIPDQRAADLIKPGNPGWANLHRDTITLLFAVAVIGSVVALALFYLIRGRIRVEAGLSGRMIPRFSAIERFSHWLLAASFIILALTGLNLVVGRAVLRPIIGDGAFGTMTAWGKLAHNYLAWPFMVALVLVFLFWVAHNIPNKIDMQWIKQGGGILKKGAHPPAKKFNFGQKMIFWAVVIGGAALSFTGIMLLFPVEAGAAADWQLYQVIHGVVAALLSAVIIAHIYIGSVGMEGAFDAMGKGEVDENWAKEHHSLWVEEMEAKNRAAPPSATPAE
ncbi:formate dehydrogenase subunit gamma [Halodurantibacterium flavum]|uniref:Formate dehydrogenase subunit gamma n=1 Tax=Halodurantibacterium flavum TaxID=1382802 RepID=A0ABW4S9H6_9RHOB